MTPSRIIIGDCQTALRGLPDESVDCVVTSPPYYAQRRYTDSENEIGIEEKPEGYIESLVSVFREIRRVLKDRGTVWLNIGDSYWGSGKGSGAPPSGKQKTNRGSLTYIGDKPPTLGKHEMYKPKDLMMLPHRLAIALQEYGWWVRMDNVWHKTNVFPSSVRDRQTVAHEYVFMLSKNRKCYYNHEAGKELTSDGKGYRNRRSVWSIPNGALKGVHTATMPIELADICIQSGCPADGIVLDPFGGDGTVGVSAVKNGVGYILIELNPVFAEQARHRIERFRNELGSEALS